jgi:hypothetical protein
MSIQSQVRYCIWRAELWGRNYGSNAEIDADVEAGKPIPGTIPDAMWTPDSAWRKQSEVGHAIRKGQAR